MNNRSADSITDYDMPTKQMLRPYDEALASLDAYLKVLQDSLLDLTAKLEPYLEPINHNQDQTTVVLPPLLGDSPFMSYIAKTISNIANINDKIHSLKIRLN